MFVVFSKIGVWLVLVILVPFGVCDTVEVCVHDVRFYIVSASA